MCQLQCKTPGCSEADEYDIVECEKCQSKTLKSRCDQGIFCRVIFETDTKKIRLTLFDDVVKDIDMPGASVSDKLLCTPQLQFTIKEDVAVAGQIV